MVACMTEEHNHTLKESPASPFRVNAKVLQMVVLVITALALPLTIAIFGIRDIRKSTQPAQEAEGLRAVLENVVDQKWQTPVLMGAVRSASREVPNGDACLKSGNDIQKLALEFRGAVLAPEKIETGGTRWLLQIPADRKTAFESAFAEMGYSHLTGEGTGDPVFFSIEIRIVP
jgi:hypothetical protein